MTLFPGPQLDLNDPDALVLTSDEQELVKQSLMMSNIQYDLNRDRPTLADLTDEAIASFMSHICVYEDTLFGEKLLKEYWQRVNDGRLEYPPI